MNGEDGGRHEELDDLVPRFTASEEALRSLLDTASRLSKARDELDAARREVVKAGEDAGRRIEAEREHIRQQLEDTDRTTASRLGEAVSAAQDILARTETQIATRMAEADRSLEASQTALADTASGLYGLTNDLKGAARDLMDCAIALRRLDPDHLERKLDRLLVQLKRSMALTAGTSAAVVGAVAAVIMTVR